VLAGPTVRSPHQGLLSGRRLTLPNCVYRTRRVCSPRFSPSAISSPVNRGCRNSSIRLNALFSDIPPHPVYFGPPPSVSVLYLTQGRPSISLWNTSQRTRSSTPYDLSRGLQFFYRWNPRTTLGPPHWTFGTSPPLSRLLKIELFARLRFFRPALFRLRGSNEVGLISPLCPLDGSTRCRYGDKLPSLARGGPLPHARVFFNAPFSLPRRVALR